jgi:nicotinamide riboside kinase
MDAQRVAILGAESTGKSTLAPALAARYGTLWVPEYLREFVDTHGRVPHEDDQPGIARTQLEREQALLPQARRFLFCDTAPLMTAVYSRIYWGRVPQELLEMEAGHDYALTLVADLTCPGCRTACSANRRRCASACTSACWRAGTNGHPVHAAERRPGAAAAARSNPCFRSRPVADRRKVRGAPASR